MTWVSLCNASELSSVSAKRGGGAEIRSRWPWLRTRCFTEQHRDPLCWAQGAHSRFPNLRGAQLVWTQYAFSVRSHSLNFDLFLGWRPRGSVLSCAAGWRLQLQRSGQEAFMRTPCGQLCGSAVARAGGGILHLGFGQPSAGSRGHPPRRAKEHHTVHSFRSSTP